MSTLKAYELTHPELLSEQKLREILKNRCIEVGNFEKLPKAELIELYKRVALPLPQRKHEKNIDHCEPKIKVDAINENTKADTEETAVSKTSIGEGAKRTSQCLQSQELNLSSPESNSSSKKICLVDDSEEEPNGSNDNKRKTDEASEDSKQSVKKRQKITWP